MQIQRTTLLLLAAAAISISACAGGGAASSGVAPAASSGVAPAASPGVAPAAGADIAPAATSSGVAPAAVGADIAPAAASSGVAPAASSGVAPAATTSGVAPAAGPIDVRATRETRALFSNLRRIAPDAVLFGHQDDLAYGVTWKREPGRSDVRDVAGDYPAMYGWELGDLEKGAPANLDGVDFEDMKRWIREGYRRGGVITIGWHMNNPASGGNAWDTTRAIYTILPGGANHDAFRTWLDAFADFVGDLKVGPFSWLGFGRPVPIIFRPYHEMTGSWFWWGRDLATPEEYIDLWRFTVEYLRDEKGLHNLLYAYSTDVFNDDETYLERYPGDEYVDILGFDDYHSIRTDEGVSGLTRRLRRVVELAEERGKIAAMTETGFEGIPYERWWTDRLLKGITADPVARRIAYVLVWRNANAADNPGHHYAPYAGHPSAPDFVRFYQDPFVLFESDLPDMYR